MSGFVPTIEVWSAISTPQFLTRLRRAALLAIAGAVVAALGSAVLLWTSPMMSSPRYPLRVAIELSHFAITIAVIWLAAPALLGLWRARRILPPAQGTAFARGTGFLALAAALGIPSFVIGVLFLANSVVTVAGRNADWFFDLVVWVDPLSGALDTLALVSSVAFAVGAQVLVSAVVSPEIRRRVLPFLATCGAGIAAWAGPLLMQPLDVEDFIARVIPFRTAFWIVSSAATAIALFLFWQQLGIAAASDQITLPAPPPLPPY